MRTLRSLALCSFLVLALHSPSKIHAEQVPTQLMRMELLVHGDPKPKAVHDFEFLEQRRVPWVPTSRNAIPFMSLQLIQLEPPSSEGRPLKVRFLYQYLGSKVADRRILIDLRALDANGRVVYHTWAMERDARIGPRVIRHGSQPILRDNDNSTAIGIPYQVLSGVKSLRVYFRDMSRQELIHFPRRPHKLKLAITRPDEDGNFEVLFTNPVGSNLNPEDHEIAFKLSIRNREGQPKDTIVQFIDYERDGKYRFPVQVLPAHFEYSSVGISIFAKQPKNEVFKQKFFIEGVGPSYRGIWVGDAGKLPELPFEDSAYR